MSTKSGAEKLSVDLVTQSGSTGGKLELNPDVFARTVKPSIVNSSVTYTRNKQRAGTHSTLTKGVMEGGAKKPWKQKGTGRARAGTATSPVWVGGAVAHGPKPKSYEISMNKKERAVALSIVLSDKLSSGLLKVISGNGTGFTFEAGKTKEAVQSLKSIGVGDSSTLIVLNEKDPKVDRAFRNIKNVKVVTAESVNTFDLLKHNFVVCNQAAVEKLQQKVTTVLSK